MYPYHQDGLFAKTLAEEKILERSQHKPVLKQKQYRTNGEKNTAYKSDQLDLDIIDRNKKEHRKLIFMFINAKWVAFGDVLIGHINILRPKDQLDKVLIILGRKNAYQT